MNGGSHAPDYKILAEQLHQTVVYHIVNFLALGKALAKCIYYSRSNAKGIDKFLKVQRVHSPYVHVAYRCRLQSFKFHAEQGAAEDIMVAALVNKEHNGGNNVRAFLHFIEEYEGLALIRGLSVFPRLNYTFLSVFPRYLVQI